MLNVFLFMQFSYPKYPVFPNRSVMLNGRVLKLVDDRTLPDLTATITAKPLILPPLSFGLYVVPDAKAKACS